MIVAGTDVSGSPERGAATFVSLVVTTQDAANRLHEKTGFKKIHMSRMKEWQRRKVIAALDFSRDEFLVFCFYVDRQVTVNDAYKRLGRREKACMRHRTYAEFDMAFLSSFRERLEEFCAKNGVEIGRLRIECDADMEKTVRRWSTKPENEGTAHGIADGVSWCNAHGIAMPGCIEMHLAGPIRRRALARIRR